MKDLFLHELEYRGEKILNSFSKKITICGCGAIGSNLAENLIRQGFTNITLIDHDRVEKHNINTQAYNQYDVGVLKSRCLADRLYDISYVECEVISKKLNSKTINKFLKNTELIIDAFDNTESRQLLTDYGKQNNISVLHAGLFEDYAEIIWNNRYVVPQTQEGLDVCDYPLARNIIMLLIPVLSEEIIKWCTNQSTNSWSITLKDLTIKELI